MSPTESLAPVELQVYDEAKVEEVKLDTENHVLSLKDGMSKPTTILDLKFIRLEK